MGDCQCNLWKSESESEANLKAGMQSQISIWSQLNIKKRELLFVLAGPPIKDNTDVSHLSSVIQAKNYRQNTTNVLTLMILKMLGWINIIFYQFT